MGSTTQSWIVVQILLLLVCSACADLPSQCGPEQFTCTNGVCIPISWVCDGTSDCPGGLDERANCSSCSPYEFQCDNSLCVQKNWLCDGENDCFDGSDEKYCSNNPARTVHCTSQEFACGNSTCFPLTRLCDGSNDCTDYSDEGGRCIQLECSESNGGCSDVCQNSPRGPLCRCPSGFKLDEDGKLCIDSDECEKHIDTCSQICSNTQGGYECACATGYNKTVDGHGCVATDWKDFGLLFVTGQRVYETKTTNTNTHVFALLYMPGEDGGMDYDYQNKAIFWADNSRQIIYSAALHGAWHNASVIAADIGRVDGIAVDWIGRNLYWTDDGKDSIEVASLNGAYRRSLVTTGLDKPRDIALDPTNGLMYWTDWGTFAKIEKCSMDGEHREILLSSNLTWPNSLALDIPNKRLYWTDGKLATIESITLDGSHRRSFFLGKKSHPFSVAVFGDRVFWTDWLSSTIEIANKKDRHDRTVLLHATKRLSNLQVIHPLLRPIGLNPCNNSECSHLCLLSPGGYTCACSNGAQPLNNPSCIKAKSPTSRAHNASARTAKPTRWIHWNRTNKKHKKKMENGDNDNPMYHNEATTRSRNKSRTNGFVCLFELCEVLGECKDNNVKHAGKAEHNCTCAERLRGQCGEISTIRRVSKNPNNKTRSNYWIPAITISSVFLVCLTFFFLLWRRLHQQDPLYMRAIYHKEPPCIKIQNLPLNDLDDYNDNTHAYKPISGYQNPLFLVSTSSHLNQTFDADSNVFQASDECEYDAMDCRTPEGLFGSGRRGRGRYSYRQINDEGEKPTLEHQFANPLYESPE